MNTTKKTLLAAALLLSSVSSFSATQLNFDGITYGNNSGNITIYSPTTTDPLNPLHKAQSDIYVGEFKMKNMSTLQIYETFCLSPQGWLASEPYNLLTFEQAKPGSNPAGLWSAGAIENVSYLWYNVHASVDNNDEGAALQLAIWDLLFDSSGIGSVNGNLDNGRFKAKWDNGASIGNGILTAYNSYITTLTSAGAATISSFYASHPGSVFRPADGSGQDVIVSTPVPEPATVVAGTVLAGLVLGTALRRKLNS
ncbi:MAG: hypothetical protein SFY81_07045 [Verrucomicrobiota bacterium]|nr:hypothetical protein [Verrucomicrobiota bacterium]